MDTNNQNANTSQNNSCGMGSGWNWCKMGQGHKIIKIIIIVLVAFFIGRMIFGLGWHNNWRGNGQVVNTITVSGKGEVVVKPDIATVSFGVIAENLDVAKAQTESATKINNIITFLKGKGVEEKDIKTTNYNIYPRYDYTRVSQVYPYTSKQILVAYVVSQTIEVKIRKISDAGVILSGVGEFGVTDVSGLSFTVDNQETVKDQARDLAIADAKAQAKVLAKGLDVRLTKIVSFSEAGNYPIYYGMEKSMMSGIGGGDAVAPSIPTGENKITSNVSITYEIK